jgi:hypothetical protein
MPPEEETKEATADAGSNNDALEQEKIDKIVKDRLDRERKKFEREKADLLKPFEGVDKDEYARLKKEAEDRENKKLEEQGKFEEIRKKWSDEKKSLQAEYEKKLAEKDNTLKRLVLDEKVRNAALKANIRPDRVEKTLKLTESNFAMDENGDIRILDDFGAETSDSLDDFFKNTFKKEMPEFYLGSEATGSGAQQSKNRQNSSSWHDLPPIERLNAARRAGTK